MGARSLIALIATVLATGCGGEAAKPPAGPAAVTVVVTRDFGAQTLSSDRAAPGQTAMNALRRSAEVETAYGGRFVTAIDGLEGSKSAAHDWLYFVNGFDPGVGATEITLEQGDVEWWDHRYWRDLIGVPAVIGSWPEPFLHGFEGERQAVAVEGPSCADAVGQALTSHGVVLSAGAAPYVVRVATFAQQIGVLADWRRSGAPVSVEDGRVRRYTGADGWQEEPEGDAVMLARNPQGIPGRSFEFLIAGRDEEAACQAAEALADRPQEIENAYAAVLDDGRVIAYGGRP